MLSGKDDEFLENGKLGVTILLGNAECDEHDNRPQMVKIQPVARYKLKDKNRQENIWGIRNEFNQVLLAHTYLAKIRKVE